MAVMFVAVMFVAVMFVDNHYENVRPYCLSSDLTR